MYEIIAEFKRSTRNKILWVADILGVEFRLYVPNWRIPKTIPKRILIKIYSPNEEINNKKFITENNIKINPQLKLSNIYSDVQKIKEHTKTIRFDPLGDPNDWEIGSPYIPKSIFGNSNDEELTIVVDWLDLKKSSMDNKKGVTQNLIEDFEIKIRDFIKVQLLEYHGEDWWNLGIGTNLRENAENRKKNKERDEPRRTYKVIDFLNFIDYLLIMKQKKNWQNIFKNFFREIYIIQAPFERISSIRNDLAHSRFKDEDFEKCKTYIADILKHIPD